MFDLDALRAALTGADRAVRVVVADTRGSAPREAGAAMVVTADAVSGTIGGGTLEYEAIAEARRWAAACAGAADGPAVPRRFLWRSLGPDLGQCCGGQVALLYECYDAAAVEDLDGEVIARPVDGRRDMPLRMRRMLAMARGEGALPAPALIDGWFVEPVRRPAHPVWIWGAGHVGRALVSVLAPLPDLEITWADTGADRFPETRPEGVTVIPAADLPTLAVHAPSAARHVIVTYSHAIDMALCDALLRTGFAGCGLIGSDTKRARFRKRLRALGHSDAAISRIACPIGDKSLGKHPQAIAVGVAGALLKDINNVTALQDAAREDTG